MKILVTGASGFLGSHVADALSEAGHDVTVFDIKQSAYLRSDQKMILGDILDEDQVRNVVTGCDVVYHLAGIADIDECAVRPVDTVKYNILGTANMLEASRRSVVKRFVFASSAYVFSNSGYFYRTSKEACESLLHNYSERYGLKYTSLRYGSLFGERADDRNSIYRLLKDALKNQKIVYHGTGNELREFIHVKDAAQSSVEILDPKYENQNIILTGSEKMKYKDLLDMINEIMGGEIELEIVPSNRDAHYKITPYNFSPKLGRKLVNNPHIDMGQGLLLCIAEIYDEIYQSQYNDSGMFISK